MATSKPVYQNYVYQNGSLYCALYKRRVINTSGTGADQWYWMPTNQSGDIIDFRANALNAGATYTSEANALANIPSGYGAPAVDRWKSDKYMSLLNMFPFDAGSSDKFKLGITDWTSNVVGLNNIVIPIYWTDVFDSYNSTGRRQDQNLTGSWSKVDDILIFCKNTGRKISLIVSMHLSSRIIDSVSKFYGTSNYEKDEWGNPIAVGDYGNGHPSLADETTGSGLSMMKDFFQKVVARYGGTTGQTYSLGAQLNWIATTITGQNEFGYNYENTVSGLTAKALSGYSPATISGFRTWVSTNVNNPKRYANKDLMNAAWGTNFSDFSTATAPTTGKAFGTATVNDFAGLFYSNWGKDFWRYL
ncbi:MAG TPA: hypothetical protein VGE24_14140, partial [Emticicia sp.]